ncbi:MAG TPA: hypothetical protein PKN86_08175 [Candidatus Obscuribacter sp.]|nr:hypothetical protein [Candidatus Obscuribacter sp.]HMX45994.1 hypothetical protein [Candidatus Obscuribacter sp.]HND07321.1 hypothetical protein [Candidatus Obscuribacter sp.]HNG18059.1 hypothetical protein [Candidatus Obscuribacter sp.]HNM49664.1 hypothetical protein [Candidatus Obscuribacter sp.]
MDFRRDGDSAGEKSTGLNSVDVLKMAVPQDKVATAHEKESSVATLDFSPLDALSLKKVEPAIQESAEKVGAAACVGAALCAGGMAGIGYRVGVQAALGAAAGAAAGSQMERASELGKAAAAGAFEAVAGGAARVGREILNGKPSDIKGRDAVKAVGEAAAALSGGVVGGAVVGGAFGALNKLWRDK